MWRIWRRRATRSGRGNRGAQARNRRLACRGAALILERTMNPARFLPLLSFAVCCFTAPLARADAISARMQQFVDQGEVAGVVTLVADKDAVLHCEAV
ncbi:MAG: hypothetical protein RLZZ244_892, partial [Verrucomicrobiota bacterium]